MPRATKNFLKCGILDYGFARIRCAECGDEYLLAHSCKSPCLCPSCQKKRQVQFGEFVATELMEKVPHRHVVLSVPRRLRPFSRGDRSRLPRRARAACSFSTMSVTSPTDRTNRSVDSRSGVRISRYPYVSEMRCAASSTRRHAGRRSGM
ncbi:MAG: transposase zinc-binding domain-containing protein [Planctomycetes bacterium]|nr:transposase zinc-binding domain-containing protein [Planctomycetota bacterium]